MSRLDLVNPIALTLLHEGAMLWPYRASALKNQKRWCFGSLVPPEAARASRGTESDWNQTQCLVTGSPNFALRLLFLEGDEVRQVDAAFSGDDAGQFSPDGRWESRVEPLGEGCHRLTVRVANHHCEVTMLAVQTLLEVFGGRFLSVFDPAPEHPWPLENVGVWPVLSGPPGEGACLLASPIILYDYPELAPETAGERCDLTETDELLQLSIQALSLSERAEALASGALARKIVQASLDLAPAEMKRLHGVLRLPGLGEKVRVRPRPGGDIFDLALSGRTATVLDVKKEIDGAAFLVLALDDDPGAELEVGHRFYFRPDEVERL